MRNNRPTEIRSLKGPRRKLKLELIDGKRYIRKQDLQHYFFDKKWTIKDFQYHFGLGHRVVRSSLYKWFDESEIDRSHREKISIKQSLSNSNKVNWYRPRKLVPLEVLESYISKSINQAELKEKLGVTNFELSSILQFYNLKLPKKDKAIDGMISFSRDEILALARLAFITNTHEDLLSGDPNRFSKALEVQYLSVFELRCIMRKLKKLYRKSRPNLPSNLIEYRFYKQLIRRVDSVVPQFYIRELNIHIDFLLNGEYVLELDGQFHTKDLDSKRDIELSKLGYKVIRVDISEFSSINDKQVRTCIKNNILPQLNQ